MSGYVMNRESLKRHCEEMCKRFGASDVPYTSGTYGEHRLVLELLEQTEWTPATERPLKDDTYLVTIERIDGEPGIDIKSFAKDLNKVSKFDFPKHKCGWYDYDSEYGYWEDTRVIAWMPLPKPYKVGEDKK